MNACTFILKLYLFIFNILLWVISIGLLAGVGYYFYAADQYKDVTENTSVLIYTIIPLILIVLIALMLLFISVLGLISACFDVKVIILIYGVLLAVVVGMQIAGAVLIVIFRGIVVEQISAGFYENLPTYANGDAFQKAVDTIQMTLMCCGVNDTNNFEEQGITTPQSCCIDTGCTTSDSTQIYPDPCIDKISEIIFQSAAISISVAVVLALIQLSGVVVAFVLVCCCRKEDSDNLIDMKSRLPKY